MADLYRVLLTEGGYTTADGPMSKVDAMTDFDQYAPYGSAFSGSFLRVVTEDEYQRIRTDLDRRNEADLATATETVRAADLIPGDVLRVPCTEDFETVTDNDGVLIHTNGTGPRAGYMWNDDEPITVLRRTTGSSLSSDGAL
jgi:hypothetical protein